MNLDDVTIEGRRPWEPNDRIDDVDVWASDGVPTLGLLSMGRSRLLFVSVLGIEGRLATWAYVPLTPAEADFCESAAFENSQQMWSFVDTLFDGRNVLFTHSNDLVLSRMHSPIESSAGVFKSTSTYLRQIADILSERADQLVRTPTREAQTEALFVFERRDETEQQLGDAERLVTADV